MYINRIANESYSDDQLSFTTLNTINEFYHSIHNQPADKEVRNLIKHQCFLKNAYLNNELL